MKLAEKLLDQLFNWKWAIVFILIFIFSLRTRQLLIEYGTFLNSGLNQWDILIGISGDPILLLYLMVPVWFLLSCMSIKEAWSMNVLVRVGSWQRWVWYAVKQFSPIVAVTLLLLGVISLLLTIGLPYEPSWSAYAESPITTFNQMSALSYESGITPYGAVVLQFMLLYLFAMAVHAFLSALYLLYSHIGFISTVYFAIYLYMLVTFRFFQGDPKWIIYNYMTFPSSYGTYDAVYPAFIALLGLLTLSVFILPLWKKRR